MKWYMQMPTWGTGSVSPESVSTYGHGSTSKWFGTPWCSIQQNDSHRAYSEVPTATSDLEVNTAWDYQGAKRGYGSMRQSPFISLCPSVSYTPEALTPKRIKIVIFSYRSVVVSPFITARYHSNWLMPRLRYWGPSCWSRDHFSFLKELQRNVLRFFLMGYVIGLEFLCMHLGEPTTPKKNK